MVEFADRVDAGRRLARLLAPLRHENAVVLGLPRGGVPVAFEVAQALGLPLDVLIVRKLGVPFQPELAMGAIGEDGVRFLDEDIVRRGGVTEEEVAAVERRERAVLDERVQRLRRGGRRSDLEGRVAVIVDDGMATGATARVACEVARHFGASRVVLAVPVAAPSTVAALAAVAEVVCMATPRLFRAVGAHYRDFSPTSDEEVTALLDRSRQRVDAAGRDCVDEDVSIPSGGVTVDGHLHVGDGASGVVLFAHGSGSSRHSPRNRYVADVLHDAGLGTVLMDLLTPEEEQDRANVFDIKLLAARLVSATQWLATREDTRPLPRGYFGASTGAGAALWAAAAPGSEVAAVVSRGGRPDLAGPRLSAVRAPTLLIVGGADRFVLDLNRQARARLTGCRSELAVVSGATHLFEEPGALAEAAGLARDWFVRYLGQAPTEADEVTRTP